MHGKKNDFGISSEKVRIKCMKCHRMHEGLRELGRKHAKERVDTQALSLRHITSKYNLYAELFKLHYLTKKGLYYKEGKQVTSLPVTSIYII